MPETMSPSGLLKVQGSSKLAFGATTAALVTLASGGTAVLVAHAVRGVTSPTSLPPGALPPDDSIGTEGLVVDYPAGTPTTPARPVVDRTAQALQDALTAQSRSRRRTITAPLVPVAPALPRGVPTAAPLPRTPPDTPRDTPPAVTPPRGGGAPVTAPTGPPVKAVTDHHGASRHQAQAHDKADRAAAQHGQVKHSGGRHARPPAHGKGRHAR
ncbi:MAG: hypothetical protein ABR549_02180 [Mycobacteriales bacterium]